MQEEKSSLVLVSDSVEGKSVHDTKNAQKESSKLTSTQNDVNSNTEIEILGGEVSDVYILGSSNGNALIQGTADDHDQEGDGTGEPMSSYIAEADPKVTGEAIDITARGITTAPNQKQTLVLQEDLSCTASISDIIDAESIVPKDP
ncbi:hypothetical protein Tco_0728219 [Tanacetum coccineum]|uniref:Uncharacterized protein n=1 Tax=Tanacetum coccineum TaxID=301880 RepID=A0ABQ4YNQ1_9ASTR